MFINFLVQEDGEAAKVLEYEGDYTLKDLEKIFLDLLDIDKEWLFFGTRPNGFTTRKKYIKTVYLRESKIT